MTLKVFKNFKNFKKTKNFVLNAASRENFNFQNFRISTQKREILNFTKISNFKISKLTKNSNFSLDCMG